MEELKKALIVKRKFNQMSLEKFINELEIYLGEKISENDKKMFKFSGLNNVSLFEKYVEF